MPDQHAAATEHELITTIAEPLGQIPDDPLAEVAVDFPIALRGYDRVAVDAYVERTAQLVAELQSIRSPESAVRRALERVGEEISSASRRRGAKP
jgi:DivIVA domain-containing protein